MKCEIHSNISSISCIFTYTIIYIWYVYCHPVPPSPHMTLMSKNANHIQVAILQLKLIPKIIVTTFTSPQKIIQFKDTVRHSINMKMNNLTTKTAIFSSLLFNLHQPPTFLYPVKFVCKRQRSITYCKKLRVIALHGT